MRYRRTLSNPCARPGVAAAELAIWLPFLVLMFAATVDFCRVYFTTQTLQNCASVAAMYASGVAYADPATTSASEAAVQAALAEGASLHPPLQASNVTISSPSGSAQVTVTYDFPLLTRLPGLAASVTITRKVTMASVPAPGT
jgi:Flp pilus assembly protein TadG